MVEEDIQMIRRLFERVGRIEEDLYGNSQEHSIRYRLSMVESNAKKIENIEKRLDGIDIAIDKIQDRIQASENGDKQNRMKLIILLIILISSYLTACLPKISGLLDIFFK